MFTVELEVTQRVEISLNAEDEMTALAMGVVRYATEPNQAELIQQRIASANVRQEAAEVVALPA